MAEKDKHSADGLDSSRARALGMLMAFESTILFMKETGKSYEPEEYREARQRYNELKRAITELMLRGMGPEQLELPFKETT